MTFKSVWPYLCGFAVVMFIGSAIFNITQIGEILKRFGWSFWILFWLESGHMSLMSL